ncbi:hypothetical protein AOCH_002784 [Aspergillus ochraceoroseus]|uniref:LysM domain-containing protein n=1 Tax=Aspergillus ochraceoroseus TaxID=138278 RepID=A0A0F8UWZ6_9EURO|nr:hypothetical protein AOCH_002784 [Aspergillus ochraceoroseus]
MIFSLSHVLIRLVPAFLLISRTYATYIPSPHTFAQCVSNRTYTVLTGDDCGGIARRNSVPRGALIAINDVLPDCSNLRVGQILCLPDPCQLYLVNPGNTCLDITEAANVALHDFLAWNPYINPECTNLLAGDEVCIGRPGATPTSTGIIPTTVSWTSGYATATVAPPGAVPHGTTQRCGSYYQVHEGDYCEAIAYNFTVSIELFQAINPDINQDCTNLVPGLYYCVLPTVDWNQTTTTTTISTYTSAPAPTSSGATSHCYEWYVIQHEDNCQRIEHIYGVSMEQMRLWNPNLSPDCSNLRLGHAYCVHGDAGSNPVFPRMVMAEPTAVVDNSIGI